MKLCCNRNGMVPKTRKKSMPSRTYLCGQFSEEDQQTRFREFWALPSWDAKKSFLRGVVDTKAPHKRRMQDVTHRKKISHDCYMHNAQGLKVKVCCSLFLATLGIGKDSFSEWMSTAADVTACNDAVDERGRARTSRNVDDGIFYS